MNPLEPYLLYIKIGAVALLLAGLFGSGIWLRGVFTERDALKLSEASAKATVTMLLESAERSAKLSREIADAIKNIRVESNTYVTSVDNGPPPNVPDGGTVVITAPGLPMPTLPGVPFANSSTNRTTSAAAGH